ncbi:hypothetical protein KGZ78_10285 [Pseudomonas aeruginosa]|nr:hypothetical protein KGZ78_10285 [Pseudomonas aeruginosa]
MEPYSSKLLIARIRGWAARAAAKATDHARLAQSSRAMCRGWLPSTRATLSRTASKGSAKCSAARCTPQRRSASSQLSRAS